MSTEKNTSSNRGELKRGKRIEVMSAPSPIALFAAASFCPGSTEGLCLSTVHSAFASCLVQAGQNPGQVPDEQAVYEGLMDAGYEIQEIHGERRLCGQALKVDMEAERRGWMEATRLALREVRGYIHPAPKVQEPPSDFALFTEEYLCENGLSRLSLSDLYKAFSFWWQERSYPQSKMPQKKSMVLQLRHQGCQVKKINSELWLCGYALSPEIARALNIQPGQACSEADKENPAA